MVKKKGRDHTEHLLSYLHWNYIYTNSHYYSHSDLCNNIHKYIYGLREVIEISHESLRYAMFAVFLKTIKKSINKDCKYLFDKNYKEVDLYLNNFDKDELRSLYKLYKIMINNIFYPWHFFRRPLGYLMLKNINSDKFYMNPYPHYYTDQSYLFFLSSISKASIDHFNDKENLDVWREFDFDINVDLHAKDFEYKNAVKKAEIEVMVADVIKNTVNDSPNKEDKFREYNELISKYNDFSFDSSSNFSRSVGFYLWEKIHFNNNYNEDSVFDWFYKTSIYKKLNIKVKDRKNEYLGDKDKKTLKKWLNKTNECIESKNVLSFH